MQYQQTALIDRMTAEERVAELCELLAAAFVRLQQRQSSHFIFLDQRQFARLRSAPERS